MQKMHRANKARFHAMPQRHDMTLSQAEMLMIVKRQQPIGAKDIASSMHLTRGAITQLLDQLVQKGYLQRQVDEHDRRGIAISLSKEGLAKLYAVRAQRSQLMREAIDTLDTEELRQMHRVQEKLLHYIEKEAK